MLNERMNNNSNSLSKVDKRSKKKVSVFWGAHHFKAYKKKEFSLDEVNIDKR